MSTTVGCIVLSMLLYIATVQCAHARGLDLSAIVLGQSVAETLEGIAVESEEWVQLPPTYLILRVSPVNYVGHSGRLSIRVFDGKVIGFSWRSEDVTYSGDHNDDDPRTNHVSKREFFVFTESITRYLGKAQFIGNAGDVRSVDHASLLLRAQWESPEEYAELQLSNGALIFSRRLLQFNDQ